MTKSGDTVMTHPEGTYLTFDFDQETEAAENTYTKCIAKGHVFCHLYRH